MERTATLARPLPPLPARQVAILRWLPADGAPRELPKFEPRRRGSGPRLPVEDGSEMSHHAVERGLAELWNEHRLAARCSGGPFWRLTVLGQQARAALDEVEDQGGIPSRGG